MLPLPLLRFRTPIIIALHLLLVPLGYLLAFALRFDLPLPAQAGSLFLISALYLLPIRLAVFYPFGLYHGWWRHVGMSDLIGLIRAVTLSSAIFLAVLFFDQRLVGFPRSVLVLDWLLAIALFGGARFAVRAGREARHNGWHGAERRGTPALVIGAGEAAERLLRQLRMGEGDFRAVGLVDDDPAKRGMRLHGVPVVGTLDELDELVVRSGAMQLVIAIPSAGRDQMKRIVERCMATAIEFKIVPPLHELLDGRAKVSQLRKVEVEDLLGRDPVRLDLDNVRRDLAGKTVLVTGGAGSIGSELARQIAGLRPDRLIVLDQAESPLYFVHLELCKAFPDLEVVPVVADITSTERIERLFAGYRPDHVFHAAAYKHVPLMEANIVEAVRNNLLGTLRVAEAAARHGASKFVLISTDKAVHPSSVMGATKRVAERIVLGWPALRASDTDFRAVRFGNVLGSDGSVVPVFRQQLAQGGPLTVTDPEVTRYFMTIPEAVQLVLQASVLPEASGRISMLDMGEPVRIVELAENLIRLSGLEPHRDVPIVFTGLRPGEKLHEELMSEVEASVPTRVEKIRIVQTDEADGAVVRRGVERLARAVEDGSPAELALGLCALVPECVAPLRELPARLSQLTHDARRHDAATIDDAIAARLG
jgi:FlaA1/EpsC-like NDP-sugar epimerase